MSLTTGTKSLLLRATGAALLLSVAWLAQAAIIITLANGDICTDGTVALAADGTIASVTPASCSAPQPGNNTLSVGNNGTGTGVTRTTTDNTINCGTGGTACTASYAGGTPVTLTAKADSGSSFTGWTGCTPTAGTPGECSVTMDSAKTVTATYTLTPTTGCPTVTGVTTVDAGSMDSKFLRATYSPAPATIYAFKMTVPAGFTKSGSFTATKTTSGTSKLLVVSECPGSLTGVPDATGVAQKACVVNQQYESTTITMTAGTAAYCKLKAGQTYYINASAKATPGGTAYTCSDSSSCQFMGSRSLPF